MTENEKIIQHNMWNNDDSLFGKFKYTKNCNLLSKFPLPSSVGRKNTSRHTTDHIADLISTVQPVFTMETPFERKKLTNG